MLGRSWTDSALLSSAPTLPRTASKPTKALPSTTTAAPAAHRHPVPAKRRRASRLVHAAEELRDLVGRGRPRVRLGPWAHRRGFGDLIQLVLGHGQVTKSPEAAETRQLLGPSDGIVGAHRLAEA